MIRICIKHLCGLFFGVLVSAPRLSRNISARRRSRSALIFVSATNVLISDSLPVRKSYFGSNIIWNDNARILRHFFYGLF